MGVFQITSLSKLGRWWYCKLSSLEKKQKLACRTLTKLLLGSTPTKGGEESRIRLRISQPFGELWNRDGPSNSPQRRWKGQTFTPSHQWDKKEEEQPWAKQFSSDEAIPKEDSYLQATASQPSLRNWKNKSFLSKGRFGQHISGSSTIGGPLTGRHRTLSS